MVRLQAEQKTLPPLRCFDRWLLTLPDIQLSAQQMRYRDQAMWVYMVPFVSNSKFLKSCLGEVFFRFGCGDVVGKKQALILEL